MISASNDTGDHYFNRLSSNITIEDTQHLNIVAISATLACLIAFTLFGNLLVLLAFYVQPRLRKAIYYPIISLALADLLCAVTAMPLYIVKKNKMDVIDERLVCDLFRFFYFFTEYASILSLMAISIERFIVIHNPMKYRGFSISARVMVTALIVCWLEALLVSSMPFYWRNDHAHDKCTNSPTKDWSFMVITVNVFFPFLVMLFCHCYIYYKTLKTFSDNDVALNVIREEDWKVERKATISFTVVIGVFALCWGPSTLYYFIRNLCSWCFNYSEFENWKDAISATMKILTFANSFINPIIYFWLNVEFRKAFVRVLRREWESKSILMTSRSRSGTANSVMAVAGHISTHV